MTSRGFPWYFLPHDVTFGSGYKYQFGKKYEYYVDDSTLDDIKSKEQDIKYKLFMLKNNCNI